MNALASIIIPTFNRAHLLGETLNSVINQTYSNWECIVVDDGSSDYTEQLMEFYSQKDPRIIFVRRPDNRPKGANACRNYGFELSKGEYVNWFDSDDLMTPNHIESKLSFIETKNLDFVVARTQNFENEKMLEPYIYNKKEYGIKASDFILLKIHWYTCDVMLKRDVAEKIRWNENMKSWQDYNYFCKMLLVTESGDYLDKIITHRRIHSNSIQKSLTINSQSFNTELLENRILTYGDISEKIDSETRKELVFGMMNICFELVRMRINSEFRREIEKIVRRQMGKKSGVYYKAALLAALLFKKGHYLLERAKLR